MSRGAVSWHPSASLERLRERAALLASLRGFFAAREVLEVETPLLCSSGVTEPALESLIVPGGASLQRPRYLQTSPEYAMKRLLAAYGQPIFQLTRAFRDGEVGSRHNPEFSLLEWYRPDFDHHRLMDEVAVLLRHCLGDLPERRYSYRELFLEHLQLDPLLAPLAELRAAARAQLDCGDLEGGRDLWLDLLLSHVIEPRLRGQGLCFVYDYPASQAALARVVDADGVAVGQRFELYVDGMELANGYCELTDAVEQRRRFERDAAERRARQLPARPLDEHLLAALEAGLPPCSGVALGVDRLLMLKSGATSIREVLAFDWSRA